MAAQSGIGIKLSLVDSKLHIDGVMDRGPAFNAGIRAGWYLVSIDGLDVSERAPGTLQPLLLGPAGSVVTLRISRQQGSPLESFDVVRNYSSSVLGRSISGHQETQLEESLVRDASISTFLQQQSIVSATFRPDRAPSPEAGSPVVRENIAFGKAATLNFPAVTSKSCAAPASAANLVDSQKHLMPASAALTAPLEHSQSSTWAELQREQLHRATRCCCELLQLASHHVRQIDSLKALNEQVHRELKEAKAETAAALSRVAVAERRAAAPVPTATFINPGSAPASDNGEVLILKSLLSRAEIEKRKLQLQLDIKISENKELARTCEDLRSGIGNLSPMTLSPRDIPP